jgi:four helix bundle protein
MAGVRDHEQLDVWKLADALRLRVREVIDRPAFRRHEKLRSQLEEAAEGPCEHIGEGFSRYLPRDNARFVRIALGSLTETIGHLGRALRRQLISAQEHAELVSLARRARGASTRYVVYLQTAKAPHLGQKQKRRANRKGKRRGKGPKNGQEQRPNPTNAPRTLNSNGEPDP